jgi:hypothetical protein
MSDPHPQYFLVRLELANSIEDPRYEKLRGFLRSKDWTPIDEESEIVEGLLHCSVHEQDLQHAARDLIGSRDRLSVECLWPTVMGDAEMVSTQRLREWRDGYIPREILR